MVSRMRRQLRLPRAKLYRVEYADTHEVFTRREDADDFAKLHDGKVIKVGHKKTYEEGKA